MTTGSLKHLLTDGDHLHPFWIPPNKILLQQDNLPRDHEIDLDTVVLKNILELSKDSWATIVTSTDSKQYRDREKTCKTNTYARRHKPSWINTIMKNITEIKVMLHNGDYVKYTYLFVR